MPVKSKEKIDRVNEAVHLLKQLVDIGFQETSQGYKDIKAVLDAWIADGSSWAGKLRLPEYGRMAHIMLPSKATATATMKLTAI
jgi:hypothetical protein